MARTETDATTFPAAKGAIGLHDAKQDVASQLSALKTDFAALAAAVQTLTAAGSTVAAETAKAKAHEVAEAGEDATRRAMDKAAESGAAIAQYARDKPFTALAVAAGAGLLIGLLTSPRK